MTVGAGLVVTNVRDGNEVSREGNKVVGLGIGTNVTGLAEASGVTGWMVGLVEGTTDVGNDDGLVDGSPLVVFDGANDFADVIAEGEGLGGVYERLLGDDVDEWTDGCIVGETLVSDDGLLEKEGLNEGSPLGTRDFEGVKLG